MITIGAISISQALIVNQTLLELHMGWNNIGDDGITAIAESLTNSRITLLSVIGCGISVVGIRSITAALSSNQNIRTLLLYDNPITIEGACLIMKSAVDSAVCEYVSINNEYWDDDEIKKMRRILDSKKRQVVRYCFV